MRRSNVYIFFFKQKTAYEMRISDWSSDVCSSDLSNQVREFIMGADGIALREPYIGEGGALTGSSRRAFEAKARREEVIRSNELLRLQQQLDHRRKKLEAQIEVLRTDLRSDELELERLIAAETAHLKQRSEEHTS